ncbi:MAG: hypothetical protein AAF098_09840 [Pseudomonadota bacterium]
MTLEFLTRYESWLILGLILIVADMVLGLEFFVLSFGVGALLVAAVLAALGSADVNASWQIALIVFAGASLAVLLPLRRYLNRKRSEGGGPDINDY